MSTFALIFTCFAGMLAFGFLFAGFAALVSLDQSEMEDLHRRSAPHRSPGFLDSVENYFRLRREVLPPSRIITHWRTRPDVRRYVWLGLGLAAAAVVAGQFASVPQ
jgi:hypothetical protein